MVAEVFIDAAFAAEPLLRAPELAARWGEPSALADFRISGLAGHLARAVFNVERYLEDPVPSGAPLLDAVTYFCTAGGSAAGDPASDFHRHIRERGEQEAEGGPAQLADRFHAALGRLAARLPGLPSDRPVLMFGQYVLPLGECLLTRLVELAVHCDDLAVSLGLPTPPFSDQAADLVVTTLARISRERHGTLAILRTLARRERAPSTAAAF